MKRKLITLALGSVLGLASTLALADRDDWRDRDHDRYGYRDDHRGQYRGDYRVDEPRRWGHSNWHYRHHHRPHGRHYWKHHVHDRWCGHAAPPVRYGPRYLGPRHSNHFGGHYDSSGRITLIISSDLN